MTGVGIAPWLSVSDAAAAISFYQAAFGAVEVYRLDGAEPGEVAVAELSVGGAGFWVQHEPGAVVGTGGPVRMIMTVGDPDSWYARAIAAGATEVYPVGDEHGWRIGRLADPFGHHWEIGRRT